MKNLTPITPSPEQLKIISANQLGTELIRGSAGSGKTTTALLRLRSLANMMRARKNRFRDESPVRILLLTFNRTLSGYVRALAKEQLTDIKGEIEINTFARWSMRKLGIQDVQHRTARNYMISLARNFDELDPCYIVKEVEYLLGRFEPENLGDYISKERTGRGILPRVNTGMRRRILNDVVYPYIQHLNEKRLIDWNGLAIKMGREVPCLEYDIIIVDESQDFSANQIRSIHYHLASDHAVTYITDTVQRIYARGFTWVEAGVSISSNRSHRLHRNHRNTQEITAFVSGILNEIAVDADGALPDLNAAVANGPLPKVILGRYNQQVSWTINYIRESVDLENETVAFLKPQGGGWFDTLKSKLDGSGIEFVDMQRNSRWPEGDVNVALTTFHSAKGLEYDHVLIIGFNQENTPFGNEELTDQIQVLRRLLAVAIARARKQVVIGYKPGEGSQLANYFETGTFEEIML